VLCAPLRGAATCRPQLLQPASPAATTKANKTKRHFLDLANKGKKYYLLLDNVTTLASLDFHSSFSEVDKL
jgi:hypothetical protein